MAKSKKILDNQSSIFDLLATSMTKDAAESKPAGSMDIDSRMREMISKELRGCQLSRYQVAARMSELVGQDITKTMLDSWTAESKEQHRFPAIFLPAFCEAVGSTRIIQDLGRIVGAFVLPGPEALRAEIQRIEEDISEAQKEKRKRQLFLREMER